jgi:hypothetical protein
MNRASPLRSAGPVFDDRWEVHDHMTPVARFAAYFDSILVRCLPSEVRVDEENALASLPGRATLVPGPSSPVRLSPTSILTSEQRADAYINAGFVPPSPAFTSLIDIDASASPAASTAADKTLAAPSMGADQSVSWIDRYSALEARPTCIVSSDERLERFHDASASPGAPAPSMGADQSVSWIDRYSALEARPTCIVSSDERLERFQGASAASLPEPGLIRSSH